MEATISKKLDTVLVEVGKLNTNISNLEKKFDNIENEFRTFKKEYNYVVERVVRLEVANENAAKAFEKYESRMQIVLDKIGARFSDKLDAFQQLNEEKVEKKLLALKLAIFTSIAAVAFSLAQFAYNILKG